MCSYRQYSVNIISLILFSQIPPGTTPVAQIEPTTAAREIHTLENHRASQRGSSGALYRI